LTETCGGTEAPKYPRGVDLQVQEFVPVD
jgi:hypothetical protein